jgi:outer membrane protein OmpU
MRKALCATTALVAANLAVGQASADSGGIKLGISGFYRASAGVLIGGDQVQTGPASGQGDFGRDSGGFRQEIRINFKGQTTLDNGLTVGVLVGLNAENAVSGGLSQNRSYVNFAGKYGDVRFGEGDPVEVLKEMCVFDPGNVTANFGVNSANQNFNNMAKRAFTTPTFAGAVHTVGTVGVAGLETANATCGGLASRGTSIDYFSPSFGGFTFGVSYTPEAGQRNASGSQGFGSGTDLKISTPENLLGVGADFNHDFGSGWTLLIGGGGEWAFSSGHNSAGGALPGNKPSTYFLGFQVGIPGGWTAGASGQYYVNYPNSGLFAATDAGTSGADGWVAAVGAAYTIDAVSLGLEGSYSQYQTFEGGFTGAGACPAGNCSGHDAIWAVGLTGAYALGPGISLEAMIAYAKYDANVGTPNPVNPMSYDAVELDAGLAIDF